ncbi:DarT ssDNA thymidine ADP-ribosyltransferase family protein [Pseudomonas mediterranea]|uniref:DarT ssDNA thymidine ADP-ribosyltransferase family protein n=1 Tax=Pseudomonas mediterranea TaxID=183795 RepID=UPI0006D8BD76|nr:DarT ssDNA thymidine ADP-ribosyltransferase family protein [Pseudomonas mediterranea]
MSEVRNIKDQKLLYHLTSAENLDGIFREGLKPRADLTTFIDVADSEILKKRQALQLDRYVPFHWFAANPFDGSVQFNRPKSKFVLISVYRSHAQKNGWKVIPRHPLANDEIQLLEYDQGFEAINWEVMSTRDYLDHDCKSICMAECLSPGIVAPNDFSILFVPNSDVETLCTEKMREAGVKVRLTVNPGMFRK